MKVDIIVRAKNGHDLTAECIRSVRANTDQQDYRLILVDDGSELAYGPEGSDILIRIAKNHGAVTATNMGLALALTFADSPYVIVMDNDTEVPAGDTTWLERFVAEIEEGGERVAAAGATTNYANPPQHILHAPTTYEADWSDGNGRSGRKKNPGSVWFVSFCVMLRKAVVAKIGYWDERYNPGNYEDTDYAVALRSAGYEIRVARSVYIIHHGHKTFGNDLQQLLAVNQGKFVQKWGLGKLYDMGIVPKKAMHEATA